MGPDNVIVKQILEVGLSYLNLTLRTTKPFKLSWYAKTHTFLCINDKLNKMVLSTCKSVSAYTHKCYTNNG